MRAEEAHDSNIKKKAKNSEQPDSLPKQEEDLKSKGKGKADK